MLADRWDLLSDRVKLVTLHESKVKLKLLVYNVNFEYQTPNYHDVLSHALYHDLMIRFKLVKRLNIKRAN